ncbi:MAG: hypothetical protein KatS3mg031_0461 [Chitinophagales bacterium]|nr:MAG: hypothetical protein KatS3mg031_0461 [Chitinophagales bacterium]
MAQLSTKAKKTLTRIGDILLPRNGDFPSFSETGSVEYVDELTRYAPESDMHDLNIVLVLLGFMPDSVLRWLVRKMGKAHHHEGVAGSLLRQLDYGLRGLIYSCYYSGKTSPQFSGKNPLDVIDFKITRIED